MCSTQHPPINRPANHPQAPMFIFRPTKFAAIYSLGNILSLCR